MRKSRSVRKHNFKEVRRDGNIFLIAQRRKSGKRYSRNLRPLQEMGRAGLRAQLRQTEGSAKALRLFFDRSEKSASKKRDGAMKDLMKNYTDSMEEYLDSTAKVPSKYLRDISKARSFRKMKSRIF